MGLITRRRFLGLAAGGFVLLAGLRLGAPLVMRRRRRGKLGDDAARLVRRCFEGLDRSRVWDAHVHVMGLGAGDTGCWVNPEMLSHLHPFKRLQYEMICEAVGMTDPATADADYLTRLLELHRQANPAGRLVLLAFDMNHATDGTPRPELSGFYTPDEYVLDVAARHPRDFVACASVHPYRDDALERLDAAADRGARAVKWLPNAMGIDPASPACDAFYRRLVERNLPLISHGGTEYAVDSQHDQELGNPLRLRRALDAGVRVVVAHCAGLGSFEDLDAPAAGRPVVDSFDLFERLFTEPRYERTLFADISSLALVHRGTDPLRRILLDEGRHHRLVYGSDYPLPALRFVLSPSALALRGYLTGEQRRLCAEIFEYNPLLFDLVVQRSLQFEQDGRTYRFRPEVFETDWLFRGVSRPSPRGPASA